jgi:hypothetical protein
MSLAKLLDDLVHRKTKVGGSGNGDALATGGRAQIRGRFIAGLAGLAAAKSREQEQTQDRAIADRSSVSFVRPHYW